MNKTLLLLLIGSGWLSLACLCLPLRLLLPAARPSASPTPIPTPVPTATGIPGLSAQELAACLDQLPRVLNQAEQAPIEGIELDEEYTLVTYGLSGDELLAPKFAEVPDQYSLPAYQLDRALHRQVWQFAAAVLPDEQQGWIDQIVFYTDGAGGSLGAVVQTDDPHTWSLELDLMDAAGFPELSTTLVHELGHLLSLNDGQIVTDTEVFYHPDDWQLYEQAQAACATYFLYGGCSKPDSYLNAFFTGFWLENYGAWLEIDSISDDDRREEAIHDFYHDHVDEFVSDYAATSPEEDLAESFTNFVFNPAPTGDTLLEQKVLFFQRYPELVTLREQLQRSLCAGLEAH